MFYYKITSNKSLVVYLDTIIIGWEFDIDEKGKIDIVFIENILLIAGKIRHPSGDYYVLL